MIFQLQILFPTLFGELSRRNLIRFDPGAIWKRGEVDSAIYGAADRQISIFYIQILFPILFFIKVIGELSRRNLIRFDPGSIWKRGEVDSAIYGAADRWTRLLIQHSFFLKFNYIFNQIFFLQIIYSQEGGKNRWGRRNPILTGLNPVGRTNNTNKQRRKSHFQVTR